MILPQSHTRSYYADSVNQPIDYAPLEGVVRTDVCVYWGWIYRDIHRSAPC
jgi:hypothetical protein